MTRSRIAVLIAAAVLVGVLGPSTLSPPARADAGDGTPGLPRLDATSVAAGEYFTCALVASGAVRCWGESDRGQLAQGNENTIGDDPGESSVAVPLPRPARSVAAGYGTACAILDTGELRCWGRGSQGALASGDQLDVGDDPGETPVRIDLGPGRTARAVTLGSDNACAILDTGQVRCWGSGSYGMLGQGSTNAVGDDPGEAPVPVSLPRPAVAIAASWSSVCAVLDTGQLYCWGGAVFGQLMQGNDTDNVGDQPGEVPVQVGTGGHQVLAISGGADFYCAVYDDHRVRCWGANAYGQLARGSTSDFGDDPGETNVGPIALPAGRSAVAVSAGAYHACALLDDGRLRCWGQGQNGALGQGNTADVGDQPGENTVGVDLGVPSRALVGGGYTSCASGASGLRCWGWNDGGQLGQGTQVPYYGTDLGEVPRLLPPIKLGGESVGRDTDADGTRDAADACPAVAGLLASGCAAVLQGKKVVVSVVLTKKKASAKCPAKVTVKVKTRTKKGKLTVTKQLKAKKSGTGCAVKGKVGLGAKPKGSATTKVTITGTKLKTKRLVAVRV